MATINGTQFNDNNTVNGGAFRFSLIGTANADTINGLAGNDILDGRGNDDQLNGGSGNDILLGGNGSDSLDGGTGADNMNGGDGIDTYFVDNAGDVAAETNDTAIGGFDTVIATVSHTLGSAIEDLFLFGGNSINGTGNSKDNQIVGNDAANILNGAAGIDLMRGGDGNDTYIVDNAADATLEDFEDSVAGIDTVKASVSYALSFGLNNLTLTGNNAIDGLGNELDNILSGNSAANILDAGQGKDTLKGGAGNDTLLGGDGNDTLNGGTGVDDMDGGAQDDIYIVDNVGDIADEQFNGNGSGVDTVQSSVSHTLGTGIENLTLTGNAAINGTGNDLDNLIEGNAAANTFNGDIGDDWLRGGNGNDTLFGGMGNDHLSGGLGNDVIFAGLGTDDRYLFDTPLGATNVDQINGFFANSDTIELLSTVFSKLAPGNVSPANFRANASGTAVDANDYLVYNTTTGALSYDANGNGIGGSTQFALLSWAPSISATDFLVVTPL